ncbi:MAG: GNAT family N-acetyltransferase [Treponema sp.]|jgi:ribosomal protein S18 acetylase RimI-like enzyme|nr:GNAT family N-acetyltransferase [Treponema sp.]
MQFELTNALIDEILFCMEDQEGEFYLDSLSGEVAGGIDFDRSILKENGRCLDLPKWDSSDGFRLMEKFAAGLKNPLIRDRLTEALDRGRGVFRAFKDVLSEYPETEKLWFGFKDREMKRKIFRWYNALREEWGLEKIGGEPEETEDLVFEDFRIREFRSDDSSQALALHRFCAEESGRVEDGQELSGHAGEDFALAIETVGGEFAGYISGRIKDKNLYISALEIKAEYRGLGLGETLLTRFLQKYRDEKTARVYLDLPAGAEGFSRVLVRQGFTPAMTRYTLEI